MWTVLISKLLSFFFGQIEAISFCECIIILLTRTPRVSNLQIVFSTEAKYKMPQRDLQCIIKVAWCQVILLVSIYIIYAPKKVNIKMHKTRWKITFVGCFKWSK